MVANVVGIVTMLVKLVGSVETVSVVVSAAEVLPVVKSGMLVEGLLVKVAVEFSLDVGGVDTGGGDAVEGRVVVVGGGTGVGVTVTVVVGSPVMSMTEMVVGIDLVTVSGSAVLVMTSVVGSDVLVTVLMMVTPPVLVLSSPPPPPPPPPPEWLSPGSSGTTEYLGFLSVVASAARIFIPDWGSAAAVVKHAARTATIGREQRILTRLLIQDQDRPAVCHRRNVCSAQSGDARFWLAGMEACVRVERCAK